MRKNISILIFLCALLLLVSCGKNPDTKPIGNIRIAVLTGPTGVGAVPMWEDSENGKTAMSYTFTAMSAPDEAAAKISSGEVDIAAVSTNLAAKLYRKTEGKIRVLAVNTLGVLSALRYEGEPVASFEDLRGRTVVTTGQGANPQYILEYLLRKNGIDPENDLTIEYKAEGTELVSVWANTPDAVLIAPSPVSASILMKYEGSEKVLDLTEEWERCSPESALMMGCIIARADFCEQHPDAVSAFLSDYAHSIDAALDDPQNTGVLCEKYGIAAKAAAAQKALPDCHICCITGEAMKTGLEGFLRVMYDADPTSVGALPDDGFWYLS